MLRLSPVSADCFVGERNLKRVLCLYFCGVPPPERHQKAWCNYIDKRLVFMKLITGEKTKEHFTANVIGSVLTSKQCLMMSP